MILCIIYYLRTFSIKYGLKYSLITFFQIEKRIANLFPNFQLKLLFSTAVFFPIKYSKADISHLCIKLKKFKIGHVIQNLFIIIRYCYK